jgi:GDP-mannose 6-dehydrogenase
MNVSVFGLGYVGCVTAACLARNGHTVIGVDANPDKVARVQTGQAPLIEGGLDDLLARAVNAGRLRATTDVATAVAETDVALICVGTPGLPSGQPDLSAIARVGRDIGTALRSRADGTFTVLLRSTALPGTTERVLTPALHETAGSQVRNLAVGVNPEFMREGASLEDFDRPPFILVGCDDPQVAGIVRQLYAGVSAELIRTEIRTAELVKYACNAFHGLKVCFANEIADLASALGADGPGVMRVFARDHKLNISEAYLRPGYAFGGSCLPKDLQALRWAARAHDVETPVLSATLPSNELQVRQAISQVLALGRRRIGVVGLAFKPGTDDLRGSPAVALVEALIGRGMDVRVLDRHVSMAGLIGANRRYIETEIPHIASILCDDPAALLAHADVIVLTNRSDDAVALAASTGPDQVVVDLTRTGLGTAHVASVPLEVSA